MLATLNCGTRRKRRSSSGFGDRRSHQPNAANMTALRHSKAITRAEPKPADSESMIANTNVASAPAPSIVPAVSTRAAVGSELSGRMTAATISATSPKTRLNQKMPRQLHTPVKMPPTTGPAASANPEVAAHTPIARLLARSSGYSWRSMDSVPGSLAAAPRPITARPGDERLHVRGERAQHRAGAEDTDPGQHDLLTAELVPDHPAGQHDAGEGEGVGADDPLQVGHVRLEAGLDVAQRHADHGVVEERQEEQRAQGGEGQRLAAHARWAHAAPG